MKDYYFYIRTLNEMISHARLIMLQGMWDDELSEKAKTWLRGVRSFDHITIHADNDSLSSRYDDYDAMIFKHCLCGLKSHKQYFGYDMKPDRVMAIADFSVRTYQCDVVYEGDNIRLNALYSLDVIETTPNMSFISYDDFKKYRKLLNEIEPLMPYISNPQNARVQTGSDNGIHFQSLNSMDEHTVPLKKDEILRFIKLCKAIYQDYDDMLDQHTKNMIIEIT